MRMAVLNVVLVEMNRHLGCGKGSGILLELVRAGAWRRYDRGDKGRRMLLRATPY
jgi:hypothetical protein